MDNLISRQAAIDALIEWYGCEPSDIGSFENIVEKLPSAQPEIIRCKDCKYCDTGIDEEGNHFLKCLAWVYGRTNENDYCSHGVRKRWLIENGAVVIAATISEQAKSD